MKTEFIKEYRNVRNQYPQLSDQECVDMLERFLEVYDDGVEL